MQLVLNADDFGYSLDTVDATVACFECGLLTSATIMVGMPATEKALDYAVAHPEFSFGVHLQFVGDGDERAVSRPRLVPGLTDPEGRLLPTNVIRRRALLGRIAPGEIEAEAVAQIQYVQLRGVNVSHVDSHRHLHKFPGIRAGLERALPRVGVDRVRNVQNVFLTRPLRNPTALVAPAWRRALMRRFVTTEHFYMPTTTADEGWEELADRLPEGRSIEIGLHPGTIDEWRRLEASTLREFVEQVRPSHDLVSWHHIAKAT